MWCLFVSMLEQMHEREDTSGWRGNEYRAGEAMDIGRGQVA